MRIVIFYQNSWSWLYSSEMGKDEHDFLSSLTNFMGIGNKHDLTDDSSPKLQNNS